MAHPDARLIEHRGGSAPSQTPHNAPADRATAFGRPRDFLGNRFVYLTISPRARGLCAGVNLNPDKYCNFDCVYCEVDRLTAPKETHLDVATMADELRRTLAWIESGEIARHPLYANVPANLLELRGVVLSGDGEPTLSPQFADAVRAVIHLRASGGSPRFKIILVTNATGLDLPEVEESLGLLNNSDEIWAKLDVGSQGYMNHINRGQASLAKILTNIRTLACRRPVIIQSLFCDLAGKKPSESEIADYIGRLNELKTSGAQIPLVQIYSAIRPISSAGCRHLSLKLLSEIARAVRKNTGLQAEIF